MEVSTGWEGCYWLTSDGIGVVEDFGGDSGKLWVEWAMSSSGSLGGVRRRMDDWLTLIG